MLESILLNLIFETILRGLLGASTWIASEILDDSVTMFSGGDFFAQIVNLIPFSESLYIPQIIKAIAFSLVLILTVFAIFKSMASPMIGEQYSVSPVKIVIRCGITIFMLFAIFGTNFGTQGADTMVTGYQGSVFVHYLEPAHFMNFTGLLSVVGTWFGRILSKLGDIIHVTKVNLLPDLENIGWGPGQYLGGLLITFSLCTSVFGAALNYIDRIISLALYVIMGPVAIAMYASPETEQTAKEWAMGLLTQFLSVFLSLILWNAFVVSINQAFDGTNLLFGLAITTAILGLMKNSEKILNAMGLRTMTAGSTANAITGGLLTIGTALAMGSRAMSMHRSVNAGGKALGGAKTTTKNLFDSAGNLANSNNLGKKQSANSLSSQLGKGASGKYDANMINSTFGFGGKNSSLKAVGNTRQTSTNSINSKSQSVSSIAGSKANAQNGSFSYREASAPNGSKVEGLMGDFQHTSSDGRVQTLTDAFIPLKNANQILTPGTSIGVGTDGNERFISNNGFAFDNEGHTIYQTTDVPPKTSQNEQTQENESDYDKIQEDARIENNDKEIAEIKETPASDDTKIIDDYDGE